jgi:general stress protein 26
MRVVAVLNPVRARGGRALARADILFEESYTTIFCSQNKDGTIHAAPIWYRYNDGAFYFASIKKSRREANIKRNNNVSLSFLRQGSKAGEEGGVPSKYALVYGKVDINFEPESIEEYSKWLFKKYAQPGEEYDAQVNPSFFRPLKVVPTEIVHFYP